MRTTLAALTLLLALALPAAAQAHFYTASSANSAWRATNYGGACGAGATFYCASLGTSDCNIRTGVHSRKCAGGYVRGPGLFWPTNCRATGVTYHARRDPRPVVNTNACW